MAHSCGKSPHHCWRSTSRSLTEEAWVQRLQGGASKSLSNRRSPAPVRTVTGMLSVESVETRCTLFHNGEEHRLLRYVATDSWDVT